MGLGCRGYGLGQKGRRHVPLAAIIGDDRDRLPVVTRQHTLDRTASLGLEDHPVANLEFEHLGVRPHLLQEAQTLDDPVIEVDEFRFGQLVNVDRHESTRVRLPSRSRGRPSASRRSLLRCSTIYPKAQQSLPKKEVRYCWRNHCKATIASHTLHYG